MPADWKDGAEEKRTTQDDVERGFHLIVRPWNEAIRPTEDNDRRSALGASSIARHASSSVKLFIKYAYRHVHADKTKFQSKRVPSYGIKKTTETKPKLRSML